MGGSSFNRFKGDCKIHRQQILNHPRSNTKITKRDKFRVSSCCFVDTHFFVSTPFCGKMGGYIHQAAQASGKEAGMENIFQEWQWRNLVYDHTEGIAELLGKEKITAYNGFGTKSEG